MTISSGGGANVPSRSTQSFPSVAAKCLLEVEAPRSGARWERLESAQRRHLARDSRRSAVHPLNRPGRRVPTVRFHPRRHRKDRAPPSRKSAGLVVPVVPRAAPGGFAGVVRQKGPRRSSVYADCASDHGPPLAIRALLGWEMGELARRTGVCAPTVARAERGQGVPRVSTVSLSSGRGRISPREHGRRCRRAAQTAAVAGLTRA